MYAEFQTFGVDVIGEWLKALTISSAWEAIEGRSIAPIFVNDVARVCLVVPASLVVLHKPSYIDDDVFPSVVLEMLCHVVGIGFYFAFHYGRSEAVP